MIIILAVTGHHLVGTGAAVETMVVDATLLPWNAGCTIVYASAVGMHGYWSCF